MSERIKGVGAPENTSTDIHIDTDYNKSFGEKPSVYFDGKQFVPKWLSDEIMCSYAFKTVDDTDEILVYREGVYSPGGEHIIESVAQARLSSRSNNRHIKETVGHIQRATRCARSEFDNDKNIINLDNGLFHIDTMELSEHTPSYLTTQKSPITYDPDATCPMITWLLNDVLQSQDVPFMLEMYGYALMQQKRMNTAVFLIGSGRNGKSTLMDILQEFVGEDLCSDITPTQMGSDDKFAVADIYGKLVNKIDDLGETPLHDLGRFKSIVDSRAVRAERKFEKPFTFVPNALCIFGCNELPRTKDTSDGFFSRVRVISFLNKYTGDSDDKNIKDKLLVKSELSGLFNIAIAAAKTAVERGEFSGGKSITDKQHEYTYASNPIALFVDTMCDINDPDNIILKDELYNQYIMWSRDNKIQVFSKKLLTIHLSEIGVTIKRSSEEERKYYYIGIAMKGQLVFGDF